MSSWRTASVALLSFSSGLPLGLVWYAIPDWMRDIGVDILTGRAVYVGAGPLGVQGDVGAVGGSLCPAILGSSSRLDGS